MKLKILAIKFKYLGDVVIATPALKAIHNHFPHCELHVLVPQEAAPLLTHLDWIHKVWHFPRVRGKAQLKASWPIIKALREEGFDRCVDFVGNDRGALISRLTGAKERLGPLVPKGFFGRKLCYTQTIEEADLNRHEAIRDLHILSAWGVPFPQSPQIELKADPALEKEAQEKLGNHSIIGHLATSQPKKEWPLSYWADLYARCETNKKSIVFTSGPSPREQSLLDDLQSINPNIPVLRDIPSLDLFMAIAAKAQCFISPDTGPLHIAAGLGTPTISLFGPTATARWAPLGEQHQALQGGLCPCSGHQHTCTYKEPCIQKISPEAVWECLQHLTFA
tara:strand:- start:48775 stop:49782 length:1008 start_codon:yes stop_codon:yes gene_type:complete